MIGAFRSSYCSIVPNILCEYIILYEYIIHIRLHPNNINRDSGIEIPEAWMPTIKKHNNRRRVQQRTTEGTATRQNDGTIGGSKCTNLSRPLWYKWYRAISRPYRPKKTSSKQSKRRDLHLKWLHRETNDNTLYYVFFSSVMLFGEETDQLHY